MERVVERSDACLHGSHARVCVPDGDGVASAGAANAPEDKATSAVLANINLFMSLSLCLIKLHASPTVLPCASERLWRWISDGGAGLTGGSGTSCVCGETRDVGCIRPECHQQCPPSSQEQS